MPNLSRQYWSISLPAGWESEHDDDCETLFNPDGPGTLQFSAIQRDEDVDESFLRYLADEHLAAGAQTGDVEYGDFSGFELSYSDDGQFWREWYLGAGRVMLFITYSCPVEDEGREDPEIDAILETLSAD